jgi:hypothetical protein
MPDRTRLADERGGIAGSAVTPGQKERVAAQRRELHPDLRQREANTKSITASGELRNTVTHAVPTARSGRVAATPERGQQRADTSAPNPRTG